MKYTIEKEAEEYAKHSCFTEYPNPSLSEDIDISDEIKEAVLYGYNKANEWHYPSKGEYPTKTDDYLLIVKQESMRVFAIGGYFVGSKEWGYVTCTYEEGCDEPIAWMPLPEPPKEKA